ncbi:hypothetical protein EVAR_91733_1, partial [Eumeta japonica]
MGGAWGVCAIYQNPLGYIGERSPAKFSTLLLEAEHIVNSRPLTEVDVEPAEAEASRL